jgi:hypothetical protein
MDVVLLLLCRLGAVGGGVVGRAGGRVLPPSCPGAPARRAAGRAWGLLVTVGGGASVRLSVRVWPLRVQAREWTRTDGRADDHMG